MIRHLIHVGFAKAGSTYLQRWFAAHPQLHYCEGGIAGFHSARDLMLRGAGAAGWPRCFVTSSEALTVPRRDAGTRERARSDGTALVRTFAETQQSACADLARLFPDAHILIVTRGFRSMMLSAYSQYVRTGGDRDMAFAQRMAAETPWDYDRVVAEYRQVFTGRVIALPYELLAEDPRAFRGEIELQLGLDPFDHAETRPNPGLSPIELRWYPRLARAAKQLPFGARFHRRLAAAAFHNRLAGPIALLDRWRPAVPVTVESIPHATLEAHRGRAEALAAEPLYRRYAADYLAGQP